MRVIIAGSRDILNYSVVKKAIKDSGFKITEVVSGKAKGVDTLGEKWAKENKIHIEPFPADWDDLSHDDAVIKTTRFGKKYDAKAGGRRNQQMADYAEAVIIIVKNKSSGSMDMARRMKKAGKTVYIKHITLTRKK